MIKGKKEGEQERKEMFISRTQGEMKNNINIWDTENLSSAACKRAKISMLEWCFFRFDK